MKAKKAVALKFDDGTERKFGDIFALKQYVDCLCDEATVAAAFPALDWLGRRKVIEDIEAMRRLRIDHERAKNKANASTPRNTVTKDDLLKHRDAHQKKFRDLRGWKKAACINFAIDAKTLKKRMEE